MKQRNTSGKPVLLIFDGHGSHITDEMIELAVNNNIELLCLPAHTTHKLQPLDVGVFGPLQTAWAQRCDIYLEGTGQGIERKHVVREYMAAQVTAFTENTILQAWRKCGIRPLNPGIFSAADFAPSQNTSTQLELPDTYPEQLPSDWEIPSSDDPTYDPEQSGTLDMDDTPNINDPNHSSDVSDSEDSESGSNSDEGEEGPQVTHVSDDSQRLARQQPHTISHMPASLPSDI
jgi:hypothetical protein